MAEFSHIPMFPLAILPLPGELVPLHIFEPRYKQLLSDAEAEDFRFGIYFSHEVNEEKIGSFMRLESVIKRYGGGESDVIVKCEDIFTMDILLRTFKNKMYPGGDVTLWNANTSIIPGAELYETFLEFLRLRNINRHVSLFTVHQIAHELGLDLADRYRFLTQHDTKKEAFLVARVKYQIHLLKQEDRSKDLFHLN
jgi:uncharacterized protein